MIGNVYYKSTPLSNCKPFKEEYICVATTAPLDCECNNKVKEVKNIK